jgi:hypothetical protein
MTRSSPNSARTIAAWLRAAKAAGAVSARVDRDGVEVRFIDAAPPTQHTEKGSSFADIEAALEKRLSGSGR